MVERRPKEEIRAALKSDFPTLGDNFFLNSSASGRYNCIAWAVGDETKWWEPSTDPRHHWPTDIPKDPSLGTITSLLKKYRFLTCASMQLSPRTEKVAIYCEDG